MVSLIPNLEIVVIDPNYMENDWDDCSLSSTSCDLRSYEHISENLFELISSSSENVLPTTDQMLGSFRYFKR